MRGLLSSCSDNEINEIVARCDSFSECLHEIGYVTITGALLRKFKSRIMELNIDTSHFSTAKRETIKRTRENVFVENADCCQTVVRRWFLKEDIPYKCSICGQEPFWNGKKMIMIMDHINGNRHDNRLSNLRWVCPNCNSQLDTSTGKNIKHRIKVVQKYFCKECGTPVSKGKELCPNCRSKQRRKVERPDALELAKLVKEKGFVYAGQEYGISARAVQKWFESEGLPHRKQEVIKWYNQKAGITPTDNNFQKTERRPMSDVIRPVNQIDIKTNQIIKTYPNQKEAARALGNNGSTHISSACRGKRKTAYGYKWSYADT